MATRRSRCQGSSETSACHLCMPPLHATSACPVSTTQSNGTASATPRVEKRLSHEESLHPWPSPNSKPPRQKASEAHSLQARAEIRDAARVILTNPDMLHGAILPNHKQWGAILSQLRYLVIDEAHMYKGAFGAHVAYIVRRLRRLTALYGASPSVVCRLLRWPRQKANLSHQESSRVIKIHQESSRVISDFVIKSRAGRLAIDLCARAHHQPLFLGGPAGVLLCDAWQPYGALRAAHWHQLSARPHSGWLPPRPPPPPHVEPSDAGEAAAETEA